MVQHNTIYDRTAQNRTYFRLKEALFKEGQNKRSTLEERMVDRGGQVGSLWGHGTDAPLNH